jgi:hypothetical protein
MIVVAQSDPQPAGLDQIFLLQQMTFPRAEK